jgi:hypothetical protein
VSGRAPGIPGGGRPPSNLVGGRPPAFGVRSVVIAYLREPRERFWGVVRSLDVTGLVVEGIDLDSFDDWLRGMTSGEEGLSASTVFFPLPRIEKVLVDAPNGSIPSLAERFERRVGRSLPDYLDGS